MPESNFQKEEQGSRENSEGFRLRESVKIMEKEERRPERILKVF